MRKVCYLQGLYRDARAAKHKIVYILLFYAGEKRDIVELEYLEIEGIEGGGGWKWNTFPL